MEFERDRNLGEVKDYWEDKRNQYMVFSGKGANRNRLIFNRYDSDGKLLSTVDHIFKRTKGDIKIYGNRDDKLLAFKQEYVANSLEEFWKNTEGSVNMIEIDFVENSIDIEHMFPIETLRNPEILENIIFCENSNLYYWVERDKKRVFLMSNDKTRKQIPVPTASFPRSVFLIANSKLEVYVNYIMSIKGYANMGFGNHVTDISCEHNVRR